MRSLRGRVARWLVPLLVLVLAVEAVLSYQAARASADLAYDRTLQLALRTFATTARADAPDTASDAAVPAALPVAVRAVLAETDAAPGDLPRFAVIAPDGRTIAGEPDLPHPTAMPGEVVLTDGRHRGQPVRVGTYAPAGAAIAAATGFAVGTRFVIAESAGPRHTLARHLFFGELLRGLVVVALLGGVAVGGYLLVLRSYRRIADALDRRDAEDLIPLDADAFADESAPVIAAVNRQMARLGALLESSRRLAADVAHQLRTPLTLLGAQAQYTLRQDDPQEMRRMIDGIVQASRSAQRLCNQMLSLSRLEAAKGLLRDGARLDLAQLVRDTALDLGLLAVDKRIDLAYEDDGEAIPVVGDEVMLRELFSNLIDNALRYTPVDERVVIRARRDGSEARVTITDTGPGIGPELRPAMFRRFHRRLDRAVGTRTRTGLGSAGSDGRGFAPGSGSGLGLAIVHQICVAHGGSVELLDGPDGRGLTVLVRLPAAVDRG